MPGEEIGSTKPVVALHILADIFHMIQVPGDTTVVIAILAPLELTFKIVVTRRAILVTGGLAPVSNNLLDPPFFRLGGRVDCVVPMLAGIGNAIGNVITLHLQDIGEVKLERGLVSAHDEEVGVTNGMYAKQRPAWIERRDLRICGGCFVSERGSGGMRQLSYHAAAIRLMAEGEPPHGRDVRRVSSTCRIRR